MSFCEMSSELQISPFCCSSSTFKISLPPKKNANSVLYWSDFMRIIEPVSIKHLVLWLRFKNNQLENATLHFAISIHFPVVIFFKMHMNMPYRDSITAVLQLCWINFWEVVQICHVSPVITVKLIEMFVVVVVFSKKNASVTARTPWHWTTCTMTNLISSARWAAERWTLPWWWNAARTSSQVLQVFPLF